MATKYTNDKNIPLSVGVWLARDTYQTPPDDGNKYISATTLLKSPRQIILTDRAHGADSAKVSDLSHMFASRLGTAIHDSIEDAWLKSYQESMSSMGYPDAVIKRVKVNVPPEELEEGDIPVYLEQRFYKEVDDWIVTGQFDFCGDGRLEDFKSTGTFTYTKGVKDDDYTMQGSIYKWGMPEIVTKDVMAIQYFFKDWQAYNVKQPNYPPSDMLEKTYPLKDVAWTDAWIRRKLSLLDTHANTPEPQLPECTDEELWRDKPKWKYYRNINKMGRATKVFDNPQEANLRFVQDGSVGLVSQTISTPRACLYCKGFNLCTQKDKYLKSGELKL